MKKKKKTWGFLFYDHVTFTITRPLSFSFSLATNINAAPNLIIIITKTSQKLDPFSPFPISCLFVQLDSDPFRSEIDLQSHWRGSIHFRFLFHPISWSSQRNDPLGIDAWSSYRCSHKGMNGINNFGEWIEFYEFKLNLKKNYAGVSADAEKQRTI